MRIGVLCRGEAAELDWAARLGFKSCQWVRFEGSPCAHPGNAWKDAARETKEAAEKRGLRISAIGALYKNPLDPAQTEHSNFVFRRAIEVAGHLGIKTVSGFSGAVIRTKVNPRGGNPLYEPLENFIPEMLAFWEPLAEFAAGHGVRIAFEHCAQGAWHLPIMSYNAMARPAIWERFFADSRFENLGIEWDPSHLICQFIDPIQNLLKFAPRIFHVHAKDAFINQSLLAQYGICHPGVAEHRFPGLGQANWPQIVLNLIRIGYDSDLNVEGWHDPVYRNTANPLPAGDTSLITGRQRELQLEETGLRIALQTLQPLVEGTS
jgi:sugar phosphate isomerase/epimerase